MFVIPSDSLSDDTAESIVLRLDGGGSDSSISSFLRSFRSSFDFNFSFVLRDRFDLFIIRTTIREKFVPMMYLSHGKKRGREREFRKFFYVEVTDIIAIPQLN